MKKLFETSLGPWDQTFFSIDGRSITDEEAIELIKKECNPYKTRHDKGVLVYMSKKIYDDFFHQDTH